MNKFEELYREIKTDENYIKPTRPRMDNWAADRWEFGPYIVAMSDAGYSRWIAKLDTNGELLWRVNDYYPAPLEYIGITEEEFNRIELREA